MKVHDRVEILDTGQEGVILMIGKDDSLLIWLNGQDESSWFEASEVERIEDDKKRC